jgi:Protein of unknown function (DUF2877)
MSAARAVFASPAARRALGDGRSGAVEVVLRRGAYVSFGEDWLLLAEPGEPYGPLSLTVHGMAGLELAPDMPVEVTGDRLMLGKTVVSLARMRVRRSAALISTPPASRRAVERTAAVVLAGLPPVAGPLRRGVDAIARASLEEAVDLLAGLGEGLTPAGDDVLVGYAGWRASSGHPPQEDLVSDDPAQVSVLAARRASQLGLAYLRCAEQSELPAPGVRVLSAIRDGSPAAASAALPGLRTWGATSGVALGWGIATAAAGPRWAPLPLQTAAHR